MERGARLYMKRKEKLIIAVDCVKDKLGLFEYAKANIEWMLMIVGETVQVRDETKNEYRKQMEKESKECFG